MVLITYSETLYTVEYIQSNSANIFLKSLKKYVCKKNSSETPYPILLSDPKSLFSWGGAFTVEAREDVLVSK